SHLGVRLRRPAAGRFRRAGAGGPRRPGAAAAERRGAGRGPQARRRPGARAHLGAAGARASRPARFGRHAAGGPRRRDPRLLRVDPRGQRRRAHGRRLRRRRHDAPDRRRALPARHGSVDTRRGVGDVEIRGYFASIREGSAVERMAVGFGAGAAKLQTVVEGYEVTPEGLRKLGSETVSAGGGKAPGAAVPAAVAVATANPVGLIVTTALKAGAEVTGRSTVEGRARQTAKEIVKQMEPRLREEGWIQ